MTRPHPEEAARIRAATSDLVEAVFATVEQVRAAALGCSGAAGGTPQRADQPFADLEQPVRALLGEPGQTAVGLGMIVAPRPSQDLPLHLAWWQVDPATGRLLPLEADLRPSSLGFYDYAAAAWFDVPRRTGHRHVVGPYVDVHGTGRYLLTFTAPVVADGRFLGVVGADVPVARFEDQLLRRVGPHAGAFVVTDEEDRVVLSTSPRWLTGCLATGGAAERDPGDPLPGVPWRLRMTDRPDFPAPLPAPPHPRRPAAGAERNPR